MSSFRLRTYFNGSSQLSVSILTNILASFLQHLLKIRMILSPVKHKQAKTTQQQIQSHLKKVDARMSFRHMTSFCILNET